MAVRALVVASCNLVAGSPFLEYCDCRWTYSKEDISIITAGQLSAMAMGRILKKVLLLRILDICVVRYDFAREFPLLLHQKAEILTPYV